MRLTFGQKYKLIEWLSNNDEKLLMTRKSRAQAADWITSELNFEVTTATINALLANWPEEAPKLKWNGKYTKGEMSLTQLKKDRARAVGLAVKKLYDQFELDYPDELIYVLNMKRKNAEK